MSVTQPYGRSYRGRDGAWFRAVQQRPEGRVRAGGVPQQVRPVRQRLRRSDGRRQRPGDHVARRPDLSKTVDRTEGHQQCQTSQ